MLHKGETSVSEEVLFVLLASLSDLAGQLVLMSDDKYHL